MFARQTKYIMRLLLELAHTVPDSYRSVPDIAEDTGMPHPYLSVMARSLSDLDYLETQRGPGGGIKLAVSPDQIVLRELFADLGELEHEPGEDPCCEASPFPNCYIGQLITTISDDVLGDDTLQTALERVQGTTRGDGTAAAS